jgi:non-ribosomal peptide synthetase component F
MPTVTELTLLDLFSGRDGSGLALIGEGYAELGELEARANRIGWMLIEAGLGPEGVVALVLPRSRLWSEAALGVLKAGASPS